MIGIYKSLKKRNEDFNRLIKGSEVYRVFVTDAYSQRPLRTGFFIVFVILYMILFVICLEGVRFYSKYDSLESLTYVKGEAIDYQSGSPRGSPSYLTVLTEGGEVEICCINGSSEHIGKEVEVWYGIDRYPFYLFIGRKDSVQYIVDGDVITDFEGYRRRSGAANSFLKNLAIYGGVLIAITLFRTWRRRRPAATMKTG